MVVSILIEDLRYAIAAIKFGLLCGRLSLLTGELRAVELLERGCVCLSLLLTSHLAAPDDRVPKFFQCGRLIERSHAFPC